MNVRHPGIMMFDKETDDWMLWIKHSCLQVVEFERRFELCIGNQSYEAFFESWDGSIVLEEIEMRFKLDQNEIYKIFYWDHEELIPKYL
jgi:hypothetical protein